MDSIFTTVFVIGALVSTLLLSVTVANTALRFDSFDRDLLKPMESKQVFTKPAFCHGLDCPDFKVIKTTKDYEERLYMASSWVNTNMLNIDYDAASHAMFQKLFKYIQGANEKNETIAMTAPVLNRIIPGQGPACENNFTMSFFMSPKVTQPPAPTDKTVYLSPLPQQTVYVSSFGGYATEDLWLKTAEALYSALAKDGKTFTKEYFYSAGYDGPYRVIDRHNEVWVVA